MCWHRLIAVCASVCRGLRDALLGLDSAALWETAVLSSTYPGLTAQQSQGVHELQAAQGHFAHSLTVHGGGWGIPELESLLGCFTGLCTKLHLLDVDSGQEAIVLSRALASQPVRSVTFRGTVACVLPSSAQIVDMHVTLRPLAVANGLFVQTPFQRFLSCLRPLRALRVLNLQLLPYRLTSADVEQIAVRHPGLQSLHLKLTVARAVGVHAVQSLQRFSSLQLMLTIIDVPSQGGLPALLYQLQGLPLGMLKVRTDQQCSPVVADLLSKCSVADLLVRSPDPAQLPLPNEREVAGCAARNWASSPVGRTYADMLDL